MNSQINQSLTEKSQSEAVEQINKPSRVLLSRALLIISILLLVLVGGIVGHYLGTKNNKASDKMPALADMINTNQRKNWKMLRSTTCQLSIQHPPSWTGEVVEGAGCGFRLKNSENASNYLLLTTVFSTSWDKILADNPKFRKISIAGAEAILPESKNDEANKFFKGVYFKKGNFIFNGLYAASPMNYEAEMLFTQIIDSIKLTANNNYYETAPTPDLDKPFKQANDVKRKSDINALLNAMNQYAADRKGVLPPIISTELKIISNTEADLCSLLVPEYLAALPIDPSLNGDHPITDCTKPYNTHYTVVRNTDGKITVSAPEAELEQNISVIR